MLRLSIRCFHFEIGFLGKQMVYAWLTLQELLALTSVVFLVALLSHVLDNRLTSLPPPNKHLITSIGSLRV